MRLTHIMKGNLLYLKSTALNVNLTQETPLHNEYINVHV